jgi:hypothetical protein
MKCRISGKVTFVVYLLTGLMVSLIASGCAARSAMMVPTSFEVAKKIPGTVKVDNVVGGRETNPLWTSQISSSSFTEALVNSVTKAGLFDSVINIGKADYILNVTILYYDQPLIGLDLDIKVKTKWELTDSKKPSPPIWSETFETTYRAKVSDAFIAAERLQKANEGAVRTNIAEGIKRLSNATF